MKRQFFSEKQQKVKISYTIYFNITMLISLIGLFVWLFITHGQNIDMLFADSEKSGGTFMNFFEPLANAAIDPVRNLESLTAFGALVFSAIAFPISSETIFDILQHNVYDIVGEKTVILYQQFMFPLLLCMSIGILLIAFLLFYMKNGRPNEKWLTVFLLISSSPFLFMLERADIVLFALILLLIFFVWHDTTPKWQVEISLICLGAAVALEPFLLVITVLLLCERRYWCFVRALLYSILIFILPYLLLGQYQEIGKILHQLFCGYEKNIGDIRYMVQYDYVGPWAYVILGISIVSAFLTNKMWKRVLLLLCSAIGVMAIAPLYVLSFLAIPIILFLKQECKNSIYSYIILTLMILIMISKPWGYLFGDFPVSTLVDKVSLFILVVTLNLEAITGWARIKFKMRRRKPVEG